MITACHEHETKKGGRGQSTTTTNNYVKFSSNVSLNSWKIHVHLNHLQISFYRQNFTGKLTSNTIIFSPNVILGSVAQCICLATRQSVKKTATRTDPFCLILFIFYTDFLFPIGFFPFVLLLALTLCFARLCDSRILVFKPGAIVGDHERGVHAVPSKYRIYSINHPGRLLNFWTLRVGRLFEVGPY